MLPKNDWRKYDKSDKGNNHFVLVLIEIFVNYAEPWSDSLSVIDWNKTKIIYINHVKVFQDHWLKFNFQYGFLIVWAVRNKKRSIPPNVYVDVLTPRW